MHGVAAAAWAADQTAAVRDDPAARIALVERCYSGPFGRAPRHLPYRRAAMSFMRWQLRRGVLEPAHSSRPGSPWWRAVNERLLRDGCEAVGLSGGLAGPVSSRTAGYWTSFADDPTARAWYRAHNASVVAAYLEHRDLAEAENAAERCLRDGTLTYAWPFEERGVWQPRRSFVLQLARRALPPERR
jgi:hypothetical protein